MTNMKLNNIFKFLLAGVAMSSLASCHNADITFPDYEGGVTTYFAYQYPVRTIVLGESETFETTLDNQHKCIIYGAMGGAYKGKDITVDISVDNTLADDMYFEDGSPVQAMPANYYTLGGNKLNYGGSFMGGVEVQLTDAFFADPAAIKNTYVIPVVMDKVSKGDATIASGTPLIEGETPVRTNSTLWSVAPMDYTLYCIKYVNQWDGSWLRRGVDVITENGETTTEVRHGKYVEDDEINYLTTQSLNSVTLPVKTNVTYQIPNTAGYALKMSNATAGENNWGAQVWYQFSEPLKSGKKYIFKCKAKASVEYTSAVWLQASGDSGNQQYNMPQMSFTTEWEDKTLEFTPTFEDTDKLAFNFGDVAIDIFLDDVSMVMDGTTDEMIKNGSFENEFVEGDEAATTDGTLWWRSWSNLQKRTPGVGYFVEGFKEETKAIECDLLLTFSESGDCTITSATEGVTATGTGKYVKDGEKKAWGNKDRDGIYLDYQVNYGPKQVAAKDTLVSRSREITKELYVPTYKK